MAAKPNTPKDPAEGSSEDLGFVIPVEEDYSQRPQRPIKLKGSIAREKPSEVTRLKPGGEPSPQRPAAEKPAPAKKSRARPRPAPPKASGSQWTVRGLAPETRELAQEAAREAGMPVGQWLDEAIRLTAEEQTSGGDAGEDTGEGYHAELVEILEEIEERLRALEHRRSFMDVLADLFGGRRE